MVTKPMPPVSLYGQPLNVLHPRDDGAFKENVTKDAVVVVGPLPSHVAEIFSTEDTYYLVTDNPELDSKDGEWHFIGANERLARSLLSRGAEKLYIGFIAVDTSGVVYVSALD